MLKIPNTEGVKYAGSKLKMLPYICEVVSDLDLEVGSKVLDGFSGTTRVSQVFAQLGYDVTANDISVWSEAFANCHLKSVMKDSELETLLRELNALKPIEGWFTQNYTNKVNEKMVKSPFQHHNLEKLDAIREHIETYNLPYEDKCVLLTSLIYALDKVDNTLGHYVSYLSKWSKRSYGNIVLEVPLRYGDGVKHRVERKDALEVVRDYHDLIYLDPPYGSNNEKMATSRVRYSAYYHIWKTIVLNDKPQLFGKVNRRADSKDKVNPSPFEDYKRDGNGDYIALKAIEKLVVDANARYVILSYSNGGRASKEQLYDFLVSNGKLVKMIEVDYKRNVMANMSWTNEWLNQSEPYKEYLFVLEK